jgi:antirestriction protein ArdC
MVANKITEMVTRQVIEGLKLGKIPWQKPWSGVHPHNFVSKHQYKGTNIMLLGIACTNKGIATPTICISWAIHNSKLETHHVGIEEVEDVSSTIK